jgi:hypothetical protein
LTQFGLLGNISTGANLLASSGQLVGEGRSADVGSSIIVIAAAGPSTLVGSIGQTAFGVSLVSVIGAMSIEGRRGELVGTAVLYKIIHLHTAPRSLGFESSLRNLDLESATRELEMEVERD